MHGTHERSAAEEQEHEDDRQVDETEQREEPGRHLALLRLAPLHALRLDLLGIDVRGEVLLVRVVDELGVELLRRAAARVRRHDEHIVRRDYVAQTRLQTEVAERLVLERLHQRVVHVGAGDGAQVHVHFLERRVELRESGDQTQRSLRVRVEEDEREGRRGDARVRRRQPPGPHLQRASVAKCDAFAGAAHRVLIDGDQLLIQEHRTTARSQVAQVIAHKEWTCENCPDRHLSSVLRFCQSYNKVNILVLTVLYWYSIFKYSTECI